MQTIKNEPNSMTYKSCSCADNLNPRTFIMHYCHSINQFNTKLL